MSRKNTANLNHGANFSITCCRYALLCAAQHSQISDITLLVVILVERPQSPVASYTILQAGLVAGT